MPNNTFEFESQTNIIPSSFSSNSTINTDMISGVDNIPVVIESNSTVKTAYGNTARDILLKLQLDNEAGRYLTIHNAGDSLVLSLLSKTKKLLSSVILEQQLPSTEGVFDKYLYVDNSGSVMWKDVESGSSNVKIFYGTTDYWNHQSHLISQKNTLYVYTDKDYIIGEHGQQIWVPGLKIGDGNAYLIDKPFLTDAIERKLAKHFADAMVHIQPGEREKWNNKLNYIDPETTETEDLLEFTRD